ncbi:hypothetical protein ACJJTC_003735 [Scirpophaga incertulas]
MEAKSATVAKIQFKSKYRMLTDYHKVVEEHDSSVSGRVAKRHFEKYYGEFITAYETLLSVDSIPSEELEDYHQKFSEVNQLMLKVEMLGMDDSSPNCQGDHQQEKVTAKLPFIELPKFSGYSSYRLCMRGKITSGRFCVIRLGNQFRQWEN